MQPNFINQVDGIIRGNGYTSTGTFTNNGSLLISENSVMSITTDTFTNGPLGRIYFGIDELNLTNSSLSVLGFANLGGTATFTCLSTCLVDNDLQVITTLTGASLQFGSVNFLGFSAGRTYSLVVRNDNVYLHSEIAAVPEPHVVLLILVGLLMISFKMKRSIR